CRWALAAGGSLVLLGEPGLPGGDGPGLLGAGGVLWGPEVLAGEAPQRGGGGAGDGRLGVLKQLDQAGQGGFRLAPGARGGRGPRRTSKSSSLSLSLSVADPIRAIRSASASRAFAFPPPASLGIAPASASVNSLPLPSRSFARAFSAASPVAAVSSPARR